MALTYNQIDLSHKIKLKHLGLCQGTKTVNQKRSKTFDKAELERLGPVAQLLRQLGRARRAQEVPDERREPGEALPTPDGENISYQIEKLTKFQKNRNALISLYSVSSVFKTKKELKIDFDSLIVTHI